VEVNDRSQSYGAIETETNKPRKHNHKDYYQFNITISNKSQLKQDNKKLSLFVFDD